MKADYVHKDTLTVTDYVELNKNNELLISYNQELLKENQQLKEKLDCDLKWAFKCDELTKENQKLKKHQKEFIKYLESKINKIRLNSNTTTLHTYSKKIIPYIEILSKYKEIIKSDK